MERLAVICIVLAQISAGLSFKTTIFTNSTDLERDDRSTNEGKLDRLLSIVTRSPINIMPRCFDNSYESIILSMEPTFVNRNCFVTAV